MSSKDIFDSKKEVQNVVKNTFMLPKDNKFTGIVSLSNTKVLQAFLEWCQYLHANFVVESSQWLEIDAGNIASVKKLDKSQIVGFDFIVCDDECTTLQECIKNGVVPIIIKENHLASLLSEFNPMKNEGNSFLFDTYNEWVIFHALTRYMENAKFPFDNRNLVKNVLKI